MEKIFHRLVKEGISPNQYYVLWCMREKISPTMVNLHLEMRGLQGEYVDGTTLSGKALSLLMEIDENFKDKKAKNEKDLMGPDHMKKIEEYRLLFPDLKLPSGKYARDAAKNLEVNFKWFFKTHEYDWETVLKATIKYIDEYSRKNYDYMRTSKYFIKKQEKNGDTTSDLANYCEMVVTGSGDSDHFHFSEKVV
jgi:hypothetical protein